MRVDDQKITELQSHRLFGDTNFVYNAPTIPMVYLDDVARLSVKYVDGICEVVRRHFADDWSKFMDWLGFSAAEKALVSAFWRPVSSDLYMRVDIGDMDGEARMLEVNAGANVGGLGYSIADRIFGEKQHLDPLKNWGIWLANFVSSQPNNGQLCVAIVEDHSIFDKMLPTIEIMTQQLRTHGITAIACGHSSLTIEGEQLEVDGQAVTHLYNLFDFVDIEQDLTGYQTILSAVSAKLVCLPMGFEGRLIGNKLCMTLVHDAYFSECFDSAVLAQLQTFIPHSSRVGSANLDILREQQSNYILKPAHGYGGIDIVCGWEMAKADWLSALDRIVEQGLNYVAQRRVNLPHHPVTVFAADTKSLQHYEAKCLKGIYVIGGQAAGGIWRVNSVEKSDIINAAQGAVVGNITVIQGEAA
jgi:hypothetical protein